MAAKLVCGLGAAMRDGTPFRDARRYPATAICDALGEFCGNMLPFRCRLTGNAGSRLGTEMARHFSITALVLVFAAAASPNGFAQSQSERTTPGRIFDLGFDGLSNGAVFKTYKANGFTVRRVKQGWTVDGNYGNPAPMIEFLVPANTVMGKAVTVTQARKEFSLDSIDIYSSVSAVNWELVGS